MICYNSKESLEAKRIYIDSKLLFSKFKSEEVEEALKLKKEVFLRQKKAVNVQELTTEVLCKLSVQYALTRLIVLEGKAYHLGLLRCTLHWSIHILRTNTTNTLPKQKQQQQQGA